MVDAMGINQRSQIVMSDEEIADFLNTQRTATLATHGPDGSIHLVAMWYGVIDGEVWIETKLKSQKAVNLTKAAGGGKPEPPKTDAAKPDTKAEPAKGDAAKGSSDAGKAANPEKK